MTRQLSWAADVILNDGSIASLRPITQSDRPLIEQFYARVSDKSKYLRFFSAHPTLSEEDIDRWILTSGYDKVTLVVEEHGEIIAVSGYELVAALLPARVGDVAFLVQDSHHGRGVANILLEHLAEIGREGNISRFTAEMLTQNRHMVQVFVRAGYSVSPQLANGFITVDFEIAPNEKSREVRERRELRAESSSIRRILNPTSICVVGDVPVQFAGEITRVSSAAELPAGDLVLAAEGATELEPLLENARTAIVLLARSQNPGMPAQEAHRIIVEARRHGLRALGPASVGLIHPAAGLNASPTPMPRAGCVGLFTQSAGVAALTLSRALQRECGLSNFIAAGSFADVTGNDVLQFWSDDDATRICLLSLDTAGNPRKFFRVLRRLALEKYVVVFIPSRALKSARHYSAEGLSHASPAALDNIIRNAGSMVVNRRDTMFDIAQILARQPVPRGRRVAVISNSSGLTEQMVQAAQRFGLRPRPTTVLDAPVEGIAAAASAALQHELVDAVLCAVVEVGEPILAQARERLAQLALTTTDTPLIGSFVGFSIPAPPATGPEKLGQLPTCDTYADALEAIATIVANEQRREQARPHPDDRLAEGDFSRARELVDAALEAPGWLSDEDCAAVLEAYGIDIVPWTCADNLDAACAAGEKLEWHVVLKCLNPALRGRAELPSIVRNIRGPRDMRSAWDALDALALQLRLGDGAEALQPVVQREVESGSSLTVHAIEDPVIGPMVSVGMSGIASELLDDKAWRVPPVRRTDAVAMLGELKASPLLRGYRGTISAKLSGVEDILMQVARLKDDIADVVEVELTPVIAGVDGAHVVGARMRVAPLGVERDPLARSIS